LKTIFTVKLFPCPFLPGTFLFVINRSEDKYNYNKLVMTPGVTFSIGPGEIFPDRMINSGEKWDT